MFSAPPVRAIISVGQGGKKKGQMEERNKGGMEGGSAGWKEGGMEGRDGFSLCTDIDITRT